MAVTVYGIPNCDQFVMVAHGIRQFCRTQLVDGGADVVVTRKAAHPRLLRLSTAPVSPKSHERRHQKAASRKGIV